MRLTKSALTTAAILSIAAAACGGSNNKTGNVAKTPGGKGLKTVTGQDVTVEAKNKFDAAMGQFNQHDAANDWNDGTCKSVAEAFDDAVSAQQNNKFAEATYNAGLAYQRCGDDKSAKGEFQKAIDSDPGNHYARAQLALYNYKETNNIENAITELERAILDAKFHNVPALVDLAMLQMLRDSPTAQWEKCQSYQNGAATMLKDFDCAKLNLQRALAIDDSYMPAFNQLALYYFASAKKRAGQQTVGRTIATNAAMGKHADQQALDLAALVVSQAVRKNPKYAPIHNTAGLILNEEGQTSSAVKEFQNAVSLDGNFFEGYMNMGAVNLSFRGWDKAAEAYKHALQMRPNDYDAHLGLALALRGQLPAGASDAQVAAVQAELDACKKIDGARPDAYFNEGILTDEYKSRGDGSSSKANSQHQIDVYGQAKQIFQTFIDKAGSNPVYAGAVQKAKDRMQDIDTTVQTIKDIMNQPPPPPTPAPAASGNKPPS